MAKKKLTLEEMLVPKAEIPYEVPENWCWTRLKFIIEKINYGYTESATMDKVGPKFLRITDIKENGVDWNTVPYCTIYEKNYDKYKLNKGDIVVARTGATTGKNYIIDEDVEAVFASYLIRFTLREDINRKYVSYFMKTQDYWNQIMEERKGIAQPGVNAQKLSNIVIPLPPLAEQERIVKRIESLFEKVDKARELVDEARNGFEKRRAAILEKAFSGELTAKWREENGVSNEKKTKKLSDLCDIIMGQSPKGSSYNDIGKGVPLVNGPVEFGPSHFSKTIKSKWTTQPTKMCKELDLLLCVRGSTLGRINIAGFEACIGRGVAAIRAKSGVDQRYINYKIHAMRNEIYNIGTGTTFPNISAQQIKDIEIFIPSIEEQREIVSILELVLGNEANIEKITNINKNIDVIKKSILAKAFRGELRSNNLDDNNSFRLLK
ncbi:MAG: restriction endonuclease subunit S [Paraclostridium sp.]|uniref:restriction endonuclease subunit S n=1 Tax=Paraclostridium sp. TaxID=2023273 RepID=UPI003F3C1FB3